MSKSVLQGPKKLNFKDLTKETNEDTLGVEKNVLENQHIEDLLERDYATNDAGSNLLDANFPP